MPLSNSVGDIAGFSRIVALIHATGRALIEFHAAALRNASGLPPADKELITTYVSGLNACERCYGVLAETAKAFEVETGLMEQLLAALPRAKP